MALEASRWRTTHSDAAALQAEVRSLPKGKLKKARQKDPNVGRSKVWYRPMTHFLEPAPSVRAWARSGWKEIKNLFARRENRR